jgi:hypothetical protein
MYACHSLTMYFASQEYAVTRVECLSSSLAPPTKLRTHGVRIVGVLCQVPHGAGMARPSRRVEREQREAASMTSAERDNESLRISLDAWVAAHLRLALETQ